MPFLGDRESAGNLFSPDVQYKVPHYQRRYVWDKTNWHKLSEDILTRLGLELKGNMDSGFDFEPIMERENISIEKDKMHFTGIIVIRQISKELQLPTILEVIDGQQRLTTFQIIFCVIRDIFESLGKSDEATEPQGQIMKRISGVPVQRFIPTKYDKAAFERIVSGQYRRKVFQNGLMFDDHDKSVMTSHNLLNVYNYFCKWIWNYVQKDENYKRLGELFSVIKAQFNFVVLKLDKEDYSEEIFESLNATGRKLSDFDYLRNNLFLRAGKMGDDQDGRSYSEVFYEKYWKFEQDGPYQWQTDKQEQFLHSFLKEKLGPNCFSAENVNPLDVYRKYSMTVANGIEDEFRQLYTYAKSYRKLEHDEDN